MLIMLENIICTHYVTELYRVKFKRERRQKASEVMDEVGQGIRHLVNLAYSITSERHLSRNLVISDMSCLPKNFLNVDTKFYV